MIQSIERPMDDDLREDFKALSDLLEKAEVLISKIRHRAQREFGDAIRVKGFSDIEIYCQICEAFGMKPEDVRKKGRTNRAFQDRMAVIEKLNELGWGPSRIARVVQRDHGAVLNVLKQLRVKS